MPVELISQFLALSGQAETSLFVCPSLFCLKLHWSRMQTCRRAASTSWLAGLFLQLVIRSELRCCFAVELYVRCQYWIGLWTSKSCTSAVENLIESRRPKGTECRSEVRCRLFACRLSDQRSHAETSGCGQLSGPS